MYMMVKDKRQLILTAVSGPEITVAPMTSSHEKFTSLILSWLYTLFSLYSDHLTTSVEPKILSSKYIDVSQLHFIHPSVHNFLFFIILFF